MISKTLKPQTLPPIDPARVTRLEEFAKKSLAWNLALGASHKIDPPHEEYRRAEQILRDERLIE